MLILNTRSTQWSKICLSAYWSIQFSSGQNIIYKPPSLTYRQLLNEVIYHAMFLLLYNTTIVVINCPKSLSFLQHWWLFRSYSSKTTLHTLPQKYMIYWWHDLYNLSLKIITYNRSCRYTNKEYVSPGSWRFKQWLYLCRWPMVSDIQRPICGHQTLPLSSQTLDYSMNSIHNVCS